MAQLYSNYPSFWNSNTERLSESLPETLSLRVEPSLHLSQKVRQLNFQLHDHPDSSLSQSTQSNHDMAVTGGTSSPDQCVSSESGQEVSCGKSAEQQAKPLFALGQPDGAFSAAQNNYSHPMARIPYPCTDPYFSGLLATYGPSPVILPQMMGMISARVPLPIDNIAADEPIYVNAKQYHGILRRRQSRAKLEAQNKLIKARKPYLHESRHRHAVNRVRGSGGRFLSTKKLQQGASDSTREGSQTGLRSGFGLSQPIASGRVNENPISSISGMSNQSHLPNDSSLFLRHEHGYSGISAAVHVGGGIMLGNANSMNGSANQHYPPVFR